MMLSMLSNKVLLGETQDTPQTLPSILEALYIRVYGAEIGRYRVYKGL